MVSGLVCWKCGLSIEELPMPLSRMAECRKCHAQLHVCKLCEFYDVHVADQCREPVADRVMEKERANFCGYFKPRPDACITRDNPRAQASKSDLDALFGLAADKNTSGVTLSATDQAKAKLDELFKK